MLELLFHAVEHFDDIPSVLAVKNNKNYQPSESACVNMFVAIKLCWSSCFTPLNILTIYCPQYTVCIGHLRLFIALLITVSRMQPSADSFGSSCSAYTSNQIHHDCCFTIFSFDGMIVDIVIDNSFPFLELKTIIIQSFSDIKI